MRRPDAGTTAVDSFFPLLDLVSPTSAQAPEVSATTAIAEHRATRLFPGCDPRPAGSTESAELNDRPVHSPPRRVGQFDAGPIRGALGAALPPFSRTRYNIKREPAWSLRRVLLSNGVDGMTQPARANSSSSR